MSYASALEAAGAKVIDEHWSGDYQGTWIMLVVYNGKLGYVSGWYGSCSGCDSYEAEMSYSMPYEHSYDNEDDFRVAMEQWEMRLAEFGRGYLGEDGSDLYTYDEILKENSDPRWDGDMENKEKVEWIKSTERYFHMAALPV